MRGEAHGAGGTEKRNLLKLFPTSCKDTNKHRYKKLYKNHREISWVGWAGPNHHPSPRAPHTRRVYRKRVP